MTIDIDTLTEAELVELNHRIVERLRFMQQARAHFSMLQLRVGERVSFQSDGQTRVFGIVTRYNRKTVTVMTPEGRRWNVSPSLLRSEASASETAGTPGEILQLPKI